MPAYDAASFLDGPRLVWDEYRPRRP